MLVLHKVSRPVVPVAQNEWKTFPLVPSYRWLLPVPTGDTSNWWTSSRTCIGRRSPSQCSSYVFVLILVLVTPVLLLEILYAKIYKTVVHVVLAITVQLDVVFCSHGPLCYMCESNFFLSAHFSVVFYLYEADHTIRVMYLVINDTFQHWEGQ